MKKYFSLSIFFLILSLVLAGCGGGGGGVIPVPTSNNDTGTIEGTLFDEINNPAAGAVIRLEPGGYSANTDVNGAFSSTIPINTYKLTVDFKGEFYSLKGEVEVIKGNPLRLNLHFASAEGFVISHPLLGRAVVRDLSSVNLSILGYRGLSGAEVTLTGASKSLVTDSTSYFRYERVLSGLQNLTVFSEDKELQETLPVTSNRDTADLRDLRATEEAVTMLEGSVRQFTLYGFNSQGELVLPSEVAWTVSNPSAGSVNSQGVFIAQSAGTTEVTGTVGGNTVIIVVIVTTGVGNITGKVTEAGTGLPLAGVTAGVSGVNTVDTTEVNGDYLLEGIPANLDVIVTVSREGVLLGSRTVSVIPDSTVTADIAVNSSPIISTPTPGNTVYPTTTPTATPVLNPTFVPNGGDPVFIPGGTFQMGDITGIGGTDVELPVHTVTVSGFYMNKYELTNAEFCRFLNSEGNLEEPEGFPWFDGNGDLTHKGIIGGPVAGAFGVRPGWEKHPAVFISWYGAVAYCNWLSEEKGLQKCYGEWSSDGSERWGVKGVNFHPEYNGYRLPTEAEWEYACRSGSETDYYWGENYYPFNYYLYCWCGGNAGDVNHPVAQLLPNSYGLYDMSGNVLEWCSDWYSAPGENDNLLPGNTYYYNQVNNGYVSSIDPAGPESGLYRVVRGGAWSIHIFDSRSSSRYGITNYPPSNCSLAFIGFRIVKSQ